MLISLLPALVASALLAAFAIWLYRRRELPVRGRSALAALRAGTLALLALLLWNPALPARAGNAVDPQPWVLVDASRSMSVGPAGSTPWDRALERIAEAERSGARVAPLSAAAGPADSLRPVDEESLLAPALRRLAESGAREVRIVSDLRLEDPVQALAELELPNLSVTIDDVGEAVRDAGVADVDVPTAGRAGEPLEVAVEVFATEAAAGDSATLTLFRDEVELASWRIALAGPGATVRRTHDTELPDSAGTVRWRAAVSLEGDPFPDDDVRTRVTEVDPATGVAAMVALAPDWEMRFLLPVLGEVSGLPARGWLRVGPDLFLPSGGGAPVGSAELRPALEDARLLVVQGAGADAPQWLLEVLQRSRRTVVLATDAAGAAAAGVPAAAARAGEWYAVAPPPPSALAGALADLPVAELPPLTRVAPPTDTAGLETALTVRRPGSGPAEAALVLLDDGERRSAVALAGGFWRWGFRSGAPRDAYRRLWSGVVGWLLELGDGAALAGVTPESPVVAAATGVTWRAPEAASGRVEIVLDSAGVPFATDTLAVDAGGRARQGALPAGTYGWTARILAPDSVAARERSWTGVLEAEAWTDEMRPPRAELTPPPRPTAAGPLGAGLPLRTRPWPYLLLLALLCAEWIGRRRSGLR